MAAKKIEYSNAQISYDKIGDVLYISFGKPRPAICDEVDQGDLIRIDPLTDEIVGITVLNYKKKYDLSVEFAKDIIPLIISKFKNHIAN